jgi:hypothetical protein
VRYETRIFLFFLTSCIAVLQGCGLALAGGALAYDEWRQNKKSTPKKE